MDRLLRDAVFFDTNTKEWFDLYGLRVNDGAFVEILSADIPKRHFEGCKTFILPGLIDAHVHITEEPIHSLFSENDPDEPIEKSVLRAKRNLQKAIQIGVTTIRDLGSFGFRALKVRDFMDSNGMLDDLPRFLTSGGFLTRYNGHAVERGIIVGPDDDPRRAAETLISRGADGIKIMNDPPVFTVSELTGIVKCAHEHGLPVAVHVFSGNAIRIAVEAGVDSLEHVGDLDDDTIREIIARDIVVVPTFVAALDTVSDRCNMPDTLFGDASLTIFNNWYEDECKVLPRLWKFGAKLACGSDGGFPGTDCDSLIREMMCWRMLNIPMQDVLWGATRGSAEALSLESELGSVAAGYSADYVVYGENPAINPEVLFSPREVWRKGKKLV